jgi:hypothetical protein
MEQKAPSGNIVQFPNPDRSKLIADSALRILEGHVHDGDRYTQAQTRALIAFDELAKAIGVIKTSAQLALATGAEFNLQRCIELCDQAQQHSVGSGS